MAVNPKYGPIPQKAMDDPNGIPGKTSGNVAVTDSSTYQRGTGLPTAGSMKGLPPFLDSPTLNPLDEAFGPAPAVGPQQ